MLMLPKIPDTALWRGSSFTASLTTAIARDAMIRKSGGFRRRTVDAGQDASLALQLREKGRGGRASSKRASEVGKGRARLCGGRVKDRLVGVAHEIAGAGRLIGRSLSRVSDRSADADWARLGESQSCLLLAHEIKGPFGGGI